MSLHKDERFLSAKGILNYCPSRRSRYGAPPKITGSGINVSKDERFKAWVKPREEPDGNKKRRMVTEAMKIVLNVIMKNHIYNFDNVMRRQKEGGPIGIDLTGDLAKVFMTWWDKQVIRRLQGIEMDPVLYKRYEDDINVAIDQVADGHIYVDGAIIQDAEEGGDVVEVQHHQRDRKRGS